MTSAGPLTPTYFGHISSTQDALVLFELCLAGNLHHVARRPHDRERGSLIKSGNVFIYEEHSSGIKRWTDGVPWSPSRILGNFLVYRELERPFPPGEKKRAMKRSRRSPGITKQDSYGAPSSSISTGYNINPVAASFEGSAGGSSINKELERSLIGSLVDSYGFKEEGLVKKTVSVTIGPISHHLVSYYTVADASSGRLNNPSKDPRFASVVPRGELLNKQNFRVSIEEIESLDRLDERTAQYGTAYPQFQRSTYGTTNQIFNAHRPLPLPNPHNSYSVQNHGGGYHNYGVSTTPTAAPHSHTTFGAQYPQPHGMYSTAKGEPDDLNQYRNQQRFGSMAGLGSDMGRVTMAPAAQQFARRPSNYEQHSSADAGLTTMTPNSIESKLTTDSGYSSSQNYFSSRDVEQSPQVHQNQRFLPPVPTQHAPYDQAPLQNSYGLSSHSETRDNHLWHSGNASAGHGHYMSSHQSWANPGSS